MKRNIKFDEDNLTFFMDVQLQRDGDWKRVGPDQARQAARSRTRQDPATIKTDELRELLVSSGDDSSDEQ